MGSAHAVKRLSCFTRTAGAVRSEGPQLIVSEGHRSGRRSQGPDHPHSLVLLLLYGTHRTDATLSSVPHFSQPDTLVNQAQHAHGPSTFQIFCTACMHISLTMPRTIHSKAVHYADSRQHPRPTQAAGFKARHRQQNAVQYDGNEERTIVAQRLNHVRRDEQLHVPLVRKDGRTDRHACNLKVEGRGRAKDDARNHPTGRLYDFSERTEFTILHISTIIAGSA